MGDTGSLALGGFVASSAFMMQMPIFIAIVGLIYLVEVLSVIIQVTYFKKTGGKRFFKMAPIHHHFELCGWSETRSRRRIFDYYGNPLPYSILRIIGGRL